MHWLRSPRYVLFALLLLAYGVDLVAQFPPDSTIQAMVRERVESGRSTGVVVGLLEPDGSVRVFAHNERKHGEPVFDARTVFEIGSITKVFTTSLLAVMVASGEVKLEDPISKYLPPRVRAPSRSGRQITLQDLATQTSGLPRMPTNFKPANPANPYADYTAEQMFAFISRYELTRDIGARYEYSNLGLGLLGQLLARRAGVSYEQLVRDRILLPLGMSSTGITFTPEMKTRLAVGHNAQGQVVSAWDIPGMAGAGALRSNVEDMLKFLAANLNPASSTVAGNVKLTHAPRHDAMGSIKIGLGWHITQRPDREIHWHNGGTAGYRTWAGFDARNRRAAVVLTNSGSSADDIGVHLLDPTVPLVEPARARNEVSLPTVTLSRYVGAYEVTPDVRFFVTRAGDQLFARATGSRQWIALRAETETDFFVKESDAHFRFIKDAAGRVTQLLMTQAGQTTPARKVR
jgi:serine-type D-Ala-D-Ala carboxypeptidase/endopeptidase